MFTSLYFRLCSLVPLCFFVTAVAAQSPTALPSKLTPAVNWAAGDKFTYQAQQSARSKRGDAEEIKHVTSGTLNLEVLSISGDLMKLRWHRKLDDSSWESTLGPWATDAANPLRKLGVILFRDGLPIELQVDRKSGAATITNRADVHAQIKQRLQSLGGNIGSRSQLSTGPERTLESGTYKPRGSLADKGPRQRNPNGLARLYLNETGREIEDFFSVFGREYGSEAPLTQSTTTKIGLSGAPAAESVSLGVKATSETNAMFSTDRKVASGRGQAEAFDDDDDDDETREGLEERFSTAGKSIERAADVQGRFELTLATGVPQRVAFTRTTRNMDGKETEVIMLRRVYLKK